MRQRAKAGIADRGGAPAATAGAALASGGTEPCIDGLLWIGGSYGFIDCGAPVNCAISARARCFVHEAEWRGVSRKVAHVPKWAVPRRTRIFLVHRGGAKTPENGKIFGYFVLNRIETLSPLQQTVPSPDLDALPWSGPEGFGGLTITVYESATGRPIHGARVKATGERDEAHAAQVEPNGRYSLALEAGRHGLEVALPGYETSQVGGVDVQSGKRRRLDLYLKRQEGAVQERRQRCWNGEEIVTHRFVGGKWQKTDEECPQPDPPDPGCPEGAVDWELCPDGSLVPASVCLGGVWVPTGVGCPEPRPPGEGAPPGDGSVEIPIDDELFAQHRSCSLRLRPRAVYLVDALCAEITARFSAKLTDSGIKESYRQARSDGERWSCVQGGRELFHRVVEAVHEGRTPRVKVQPLLQGKADLRGELVVFKRAVPFVKRPRAYSRSLERIDGDHLLAQIATGVRVPKILICGTAGQGKGLTRSQVAARLAGAQNLSLAAVHRFMDELAALAKRELVIGRSFRLPGLVPLPPVPAATAGMPGQKAVRPLPKAEIAASLAGDMAGKASSAGARAPSLSQRQVERLLDELGKLVTTELERTGALRLPRLGTFRRKSGGVRFTPSTVLGA